MVLRHELTSTAREGFHTELGYVPRVNMRQAQQFFMRRFRPKSKRVLVFSPNISVLGNLDHQGVQQDWRVNPAFNLRDAARHLPGANIRRSSSDSRTSISAAMMPMSSCTPSTSKRATFDFNYSTGTRTNYEPAPGLVPFLANGSELQAGFTLRPWRASRSTRSIT